MSKEIEPIKVNYEKESEASIYIIEEASQYDIIKIKGMLNNCILKIEVEKEQIVALIIGQSKSFYIIINPDVKSNEFKSVIELVNKYQQTKLKLTTNPFNPIFICGDDDDFKLLKAVFGKELKEQYSIQAVDEKYQSEQEQIWAEKGKDKYKIYSEPDIDGDEDFAELITNNPQYFCQDVFYANALLGYKAASKLPGEDTALLERRQQEQKEKKQEAVEKRKGRKKVEDGEELKIEVDPERKKEQKNSDKREEKPRAKTDFEKMLKDNKLQRGIFIKSEDRKQQKVDVSDVKMELKKFGCEGEILTVKDQGETFYLYPTGQKIIKASDLRESKPDWSIILPYIPDEKANQKREKEGQATDAEPEKMKIEVEPEQPKIDFQKLLGDVKQAVFVAKTDNKKNEIKFSHVAGLFEEYGLEDIKNVEDMGIKLFMVPCEKMDMKQLQSKKPDWPMWLMHVKEEKKEEPLPKFDFQKFLSEAKAKQAIFVQKLDKNKNELKLASVATAFEEYKLEEIKPVEDQGLKMFMIPCEKIDMKKLQSQQPSWSMWLIQATGEIKTVKKEEELPKFDFQKCLRDNNIKQALFVNQFDSDKKKIKMGELSAYFDQFDDISTVEEEGIKYYMINTKEAKVEIQKLREGRPNWGVWLVAKK